MFSTFFRTSLHSPCIGLLLPPLGLPVRAVIAPVHKRPNLRGGCGDGA
ncbi:hypothetical protein [Corynebacterium ciconiae]|nr:hypothetical protein [Corynebacterium ciconiae]